MGKPIAGKNQYPYQINGIVVDGAKINGGTYVKSLFIYQQRSYNYYDLIDSAGNIYEYIEIVWRDQNGTSLNYFDNSSFIVDNIKDNSFFIKIQDIPRSIFGFITLIHLNKIKVSTGDYIFYHEDDDYSLLSVRCVPATIQANINDEIRIDALFLPNDYPNQSGFWHIENSKLVQIMDTTISNSVGVFRCLEPGHVTVTFNPSANSMLSATAQIYISDEEQTYTSFRLIQNVPNGISMSNDNTFFPGDEITFTAVFTPFDYVPTRPFEMIYDDTIFEYLGTTDNINYKMKVREDTQFSEIRTTVELRDGEMYAIAQPIVRLLTTSIYTGVAGPTYTRVGESYQYTMEYYSKPVNPEYTWTVKEPSIGTITNDGVYTPIAAGENMVFQNTNGGYNKNGKYVYSSQYIPDIYMYSPNDRFTYFVGEEIQLSVETVPSTIPVRGTWRLRHPFTDEEYVSISSTGLLKIKKEPPYPGYVLYVGFTYEGSNNVGGTVDSDNSSLEKFFTIEPAGTINPITHFITPTSDRTTYIPLGGKTISSISVQPTNATGTKEWTYEFSNPGIVELEYNPYFMNCDVSSTIYYKGISRGQTDITYISVQDPSVKLTITLTVF